MATYINTGTEFYQLDATTDIRYTTSGTLTSNPVEGGIKDVSDHFNQAQDRVSFSGILTRYKAKGKETQYIKSPEEYLRNLRSVKDNSVVVSIVFFTSEATLFDSTPEQPLPPMESAIIESIEVSKQSGNGELLVSISAKQVTFADQTEVTISKVPAQDMIDNATNQATGISQTQEAKGKLLIETVEELASEGPGI